MDPRKPYGDPDGKRWTLPIHSPLPEQVPVGHFEPHAIEPVLDETVSCAEYLDRIHQASIDCGEGFHLRFYDHVDQVFDASILNGLTDLQNLTIEVNCPIMNPEAVAGLTKLKGLSLSPRAKSDANLLDRMGVQRLEHFTLGDTSTPKLNLGPLGEARALRTLRLLARGKDVEAIGNCTSLVELSMHPSEKDDLSFVSRLPRLQVLKFSLGKRRSISQIQSAPALRDLSFHWVHTLEDLGDLQRFPTLRRLQIEQQKQLKTLRVGPANISLEHIKSEGLDVVEGFPQLPALKSFNNFNGKFAPDWSELPPTLTHFALVTPSLRKRETHYAQVRAHGLEPELHPDARFFYK